MGAATVNNPIPGWMRDAFGSVPGTRAALRTGIYWFQEALGFAMTKRPELLVLGEGREVEHPPPGP